MLKFNCPCCLSYNSSCSSVSQEIRFQRGVRRAKVTGALKDNIAKVACDECLQVLGPLLEQFRVARRHTAAKMLKARAQKKKRQNGSAEGMQDIGIDRAAEEKWIASNVFDPYGNSIVHSTCASILLHVSMQRISRIRKQKQMMGQRPILAVKKKDITWADIPLIEVPYMVDSLKWFTSLPPDATVRVHNPGHRHGNFGKPSHSKQLYREHFRSFVSIRYARLRQRRSIFYVVCLIAIPQISDKWAFGII